ncbi:hypothetical protein C8F00_2052 [Xanthomonas vasicola]
MQGLIRRTLALVIDEWRSCSVPLLNAAASNDD